MKVIAPSVEILTPIDSDVVLKHIELCGRTCYKSEDKITEGSAQKFVQGIIKSGHESVIEHFSISVRFITDRGVTHELVRHRIASPSQESTRYCNYGQKKFGSELTFICPTWALSMIDELRPPLTPKGKLLFFNWHSACEYSEQMYKTMLNNGATPQEARAVLPNSLKTEIVFTANLREWRHILKLRTSKRAHPDIRHIMTILYCKLLLLLPDVFEDIKMED